LASHFFLTGSLALVVLVKAAVLGDFEEAATLAGVVALLDVVFLVPVTTLDGVVVLLDAADALDGTLAAAAFTCVATVDALVVLAVTFLTGISLGAVVAFVTLACFSGLVAFVCLSRNAVPWWWRCRWPAFDQVPRDLPSGDQGILSLLMRLRRDFLFNMARWA